MRTTSERRRVGPNAVLVIGGQGFVGTRVVAALERLGHWEVWVGSRAPTGDRGVRIDLLDAATFPVLDRFLAVVNCADVVRALPDAAADHCLRSGTVFIQPTGDLDTLLRLRMHATAMAPAGLPGLLVLGAGMHPGLTGVLAAACPGEGVCDIAVRLSPFAAAGPGMRRLWAEAASAPHREWRGQARELVTPEHRVVDFPERSSTVMRFPLADGELLNARGRGDVSTWLGFGRFTAVVRLVRRLTAGGDPRLRRVMGPVLQLVLLFLSPLSLLRSPLALRAERGGTVRTVSVDDALAATAAAIAAVTNATLEKRPLPGVVAPADYLSLQDLKPLMVSLTPEVRWRWAARG